MEILEQKHGKSMDEGHLGGWALEGDGGTYYPVMWEHLINIFNIKSVLDIGCGRGFSTRFFKSLGCKITGIDGSINAKKLTLLDSDEFYLHDYSKGETDISESYDLCWTCEFVEHVDAQYISNFVNDFKKCKYVAMTFAAIGQGGHHHVNENTQEYWVDILEKAGFSFSEQYTKLFRALALVDKKDRENTANCPFFISHFVERGLFFERK